MNNVDADGSGHLSRDDLFEHIKENLEQDEGPLSAEDMELLREAVKIGYRLCPAIYHRLPTSFKLSASPFNQF